LQRAEIAEPGKAGGEAGESEKKLGAVGGNLKASLRAGDKSATPSQQDNYSGADGGGKIGIDASDAKLGENGGSRRKERR